MVTSKLLTAEDVWNMDDDGCRHELLRGELRAMPPTNDEHGQLMFRLSGLIFAYQQRQPILRWFAGDPGFLLARDPDTLLGPDLAAVRVERLPEDFPRRSYFDIVPDLVVEILSPSERVGQVNDKIATYLDAGVRMIWIVNPEQRSVTVHTLDQHTRIFEDDDTLDGGEVLPEFELSLSDLFS